MAEALPTDRDPTDDVVAGFLRTLGFPADPFQLRAVEALRDGRSVLVAAPTGAGKTVVGEFACHDALAGRQGLLHHPDQGAVEPEVPRPRRPVRRGAVGLLTGDRSINGDAPVVVMTTEVLRNMIYEASPTLRGLRHVVLDEVHYLADRSRGAVWEEVIIQLPASVQLAALSATVSNAEDFGRWLDEVRDGCEVVIEEDRPVPLRHHYFVNDRIYDTFRAGRKGGASREHRERARRPSPGSRTPTSSCSNAGRGSATA
jgi:ATP-dependent RNA helicase HelY